MLELTRPFGAPVRPFLSALVTAERVREPWQEAGYWALRRQIFCRELRLFAAAEQEQDPHDAHALAFVAVAHSAGTPDGVVGVVRAYRADDGCWYGGRLGVARPYRARPRVGSVLIRAAVLGAAQRGCTRFLALVLQPNVAYFERHHFAALHAVEHCGRPHVLMEADLVALALTAVPVAGSQAAAASIARRAA